MNTSDINAVLIDIVIGKLRYNITVYTDEYGKEDLIVIRAWDPDIGVDYVIICEYDVGNTYGWYWS